MKAGRGNKEERERQQGHFFPKMLSNVTIALR